MTTGKLQAHKTSAGLTIWLTGLSGAGKSTLAALLTDRLREAGGRRWNGWTAMNCGAAWGGDSASAARTGSRTSAGQSISPGC
ncbi:adenylyl-sulfate kinase [Paenibacillus rhizoplanae]